MKTPDASIIKLIPFTETDFDLLISWVDSKELLMTIAGPFYSYPLTPEQLSNYLADEKSHSFTVVNEKGNKIGHAEVAKTGDGLFKIDKLIVGDPSMRGKGLGERIMRELTSYAFNKLNADVVELNVFSWNTAGVRCYEKVGFRINPEKEMSFKVGAEDWTVLNMTVGMEDFG